VFQNLFFGTLFALPPLWRGTAVDVDLLDISKGEHVDFGSPDNLDASHKAELVCAQLGCNSNTNSPPKFEN